MEERVKRELARKRAILLTVLCILLPPLGVLLVWRNRLSVARKAARTVLATVSLTIALTIALTVTRVPEDLRPAPVSASTLSGNNLTSLQEGGTDTQPTPAPDDGYVAPSNPNP